MNLKRKRKTDKQKLNRKVKLSNLAGNNSEDKKTARSDQKEETKETFFTKNLKLQQITILSSGSSKFLVIKKKQLIIY